MATRVRWLGHSALLVEGEGRNVLIDPFLTGNPKAAAKADDVPADLILISHGHGDHVGDAVAIARRTGATVASNYEISLWLQQPPRGWRIEGPGAPARRQLPVRRVDPGQADAGLPRLGAARREQRRQSLRLRPDLPRRHQGLRRRRHRAVRRHGADRRGGDRPAMLPIGDYYTMGPDDAVRAVKLLSPASSFRSTTTRSRPSPRTSRPGPRASRPRRRPSRSSSSRGTGSRSPRNEVGPGHVDSTVADGVCRVGRSRAGLAPMISILDEKSMAAFRTCPYLDGLLVSVPSELLRGLQWLCPYPPRNRPSTAAYAEIDHGSSAIG